MSDDRPTADRWLTYIETGELLGISPEAARAIARRQKWPRQSANAIGRAVRVLVPADRLRPVTANGQENTGQWPRPVIANGHDRTEPYTNGHDRIAELREMAELFMAPVREQ